MIELTEKVKSALVGYVGKKFAIGVSGGRDSMCLLHAVLHSGAIEKSNIIVVHVNHMLRENADRDENVVRLFCERSGIKFRAFRVDVKAECVRSGHTVEQAARDLRYGIFGDLLKNGAADYVLTAHHALDNAETVLMHMFRGAGVDGLRAMSVADVSRRIVRPFLSVYPSEFDSYASENGIEYVVDETNFSDDADRNFIRLNVIPVIEQRYAGVVQAVNALAAECGDVCDFLDDALDNDMLYLDSGAMVVKTEALLGALGRRYIRRAISYFSLTDITREHIERVIKLAHMRTGATVELSGDIKAAREYDGVAIFTEREKCNAQVQIKLGANFIDGLAIDIEHSDVLPCDMAGCCVDFDKLDGGVLRFRRDGDMFKPFGGSTKKLKQYLIDKKIPKRLRDRLPLICRGNEVLVIVGMEISDDVKQTERTTAKCTAVRRV